MFRVYLVLLPLLSVCPSAPLVRALRPPASPVLTVHSLPAPLVTQSATSPQQRISDSLTAMISPLKDIVIATVLGIGAGMIWNNFKDGELGRITRYYQWHDAQEALKKNAHADD